MGKTQTRSTEEMYSKKIKHYKDGTVCLTTTGKTVPAICHCGFDIQLKGDVFKCKDDHVFGMKKEL